MPEVTPTELADADHETVSSIRPVDVILGVVVSIDLYGSETEVGMLLLDERNEQASQLGVPGRRLGHPDHVTVSEQAEEQPPDHHSIRRNVPALLQWEAQALEDTTHVILGDAP